MARKAVSGIINGKAPITPETALRLEKVFRVPAHFWNNLQKNYDEARGRMDERGREILAQYAAWPEEMGIPVRKLKKQGLIPDVCDKVELVAEVLKFFGVTTPAEFSAVWSGIQSEWARERRRESREIGKGEFGVRRKGG